jgi:hypothetical protein
MPIAHGASNNTDLATRNLHNELERIAFRIGAPHRRSRNSSADFQLRENTPDLADEMSQTPLAPDTS